MDVEAPRERESLPQSQVRSLCSPASPGCTQPPGSACPVLRNASCSPGQHPWRAGPNKTRCSAALQASCRDELREGSRGRVSLEEIRHKEHAPLGGGWGGGAQGCVQIIGPTDLVCGLLRKDLSKRVWTFAPGTIPGQVNGLAGCTGTLGSLGCPPSPQHLGPLFRNIL